MTKHSSSPQVSRRGIFAAAGVGAAAAAATAIPAAQPAHAKRFPGRGRTVIPGADVAAGDGWKVFAGRRIGIITNPTGLVRDGLRSIVDAMSESGKVEIGAVFGPEHGFRGTAQAGESEETFIDERTGVTVYDAHGAQASKFASFYEQSKVDTIVFDIQDVGVRFYTYIWTMYQAMIAAVKTGKDFIVLDRPNPVGGKVHGSMMTDGFTSGVGQDKILQAHGMTAGEVARFFNGELMRKAAGGVLKNEVQVVQLKAWKPDSLFHDTNIPWVPPSPNVPTTTTALLYYGTGMFEATNMSEGRGTTLPFELLGAPYADYRWAKKLNELKLPGVEFREAYFTPTFSKFVGETCAGVQVVVNDPDEVKSIELTTHMFTTARDLYDEFGWRTLDGANPGRWLGLLTGSKRFQTMFEAGKSAEDIIAAWRPEEKAFDAQRQPYLIYKR